MIEPSAPDRYRGTARPMSAEIVDYFRSFFDPDDAILDVGSGAGALLWGDSVGIDLDVGFVRGSGKRFVQADVGATLPFRDATFDGAIAKDIIEHVAQPLYLLRELRRVTRPSGTLVITTPRAVPRAVWADYTHVRGFTRGAIEMLMHDAGWDLARLRRIGGVPLAGRLNMIHRLPALLSVPGIGHYFGTNWLVIATR